MSPLLIALGDLTEWFELMDDYEGKEVNRAAWLATQWSVYGEENSDAEWVELRHTAELLIAEWRAQRNADTIAPKAPEIKDFRPVPTTIDEATTRLCDDIIRTVRRVA
jgi:hypothetical protein